MKGLGILTNPLAAAQKGEAAAAADIGAQKFQAGLGHSSGSFLKALDVARESQPPVAREIPRAERQPARETAAEDRRPAEQAPEDRPVARRDESAESNGSEQSAHRDDAEQRPSDREEERSGKEETGARKVNESSEKKTARKSEDGDRDAKKIAGEKAAEKKHAAPRVEEQVKWDDLAAAFETMMADVQAEVDAETNRSSADGAKLKQTEIESEDKRTAKILAESSPLAPAGATEKEVSMKAEASGKESVKENAREDNRSETRKGRETNDADKRGVATVRENVIEKSSEQILDPAKWSVAGRAGREAVTESEGKTKTSNRTTAVRFDPVARSMEETSSREGGSQNQSSFGGDREFAALRDQAAARLMASNVDRQAALRESRELFNSLVQKARVNLGAEGKSSATIRLKPEFLGNMTLNLKVNGNSVEAVLLVDNKAALKLLGDEIENMRQELKLAGIQVESFALKVRESSMAFMNGDQADGGTAAERGGQNEGAGREQGADQEAGADNNAEEGPGGAVAESEYELHLNEENAAEKIGVDLAV